MVFTGHRKRRYSWMTGPAITAIFVLALTRALPASDIFSHHRVMNSCHICTMAIKLKRKLKWDPAKEQFIGDEEANAMISRLQREPYRIEV